MEGPDGTIELKSNECEFCLCDNKWHSVQVEFHSDGVVLKVDDGMSSDKGRDPMERVGGHEHELHMGLMPRKF